MNGETSFLLRFARRFCVWLVCALVAPLLAPQMAHAQTSISFPGVGTVDAAIVPKLGLVEAESLNFGAMTPGTTGGTVVVSPLGVRTLGAASTVVLAGGTVSGARFDGYGNRNQFVRVTIQAATILRRTGAPLIALPLDLMTVDQFTLGLATNSGLQVVGAGNGVGTRYKINRPNGLFDFRVGARLTVKPNQTGGEYSGSYLVTVIYN